MEVFFNVISTIPSLFTYRVKQLRTENQRILMEYQKAISEKVFLLHDNA